MDGISASPRRLNAAQRSAHIREVVLAKGVELRQRYPILNHQDALGAGILAFALSGMIGSAALYITGYMAWWVCLLLNAFFASLTHELEHDLIHSMYFRKQRVPHNLMMGLVWMARPSTINPWIRRHLHLNHHKGGENSGANCGRGARLKALSRANQGQWNYFPVVEKRLRQYLLHNPVNGVVMAVTKGYSAHQGCWA
ncbi:fatty acid desaturase [Pseudomonas sp. B21-048]|uniref:fatty acid desaturase n=1 Tax=Pseudomonas sp. B21-048 TaxID=2895490 RepID=UPI0038D42704